MEHEHHPHHPHHGTGFRWLDITLGVAATIVSLVSLWLGLHSAHSMERLVAANSYPYVEQWRSMGSDVPLPGTDRNRQKVEYSFHNNGVGPARIDWVEVTFKDKPVADLSELLEACCNANKADATTLDRRGSVDGSLIRPGAALSIFTWDEPTTANPAFAALHDQMNKIQVTACYCSVFEECYLRRPSAAKPEPVKECVAPAKPFRPGWRDDT